MTDDEDVPERLGTKEALARIAARAADASVPLDLRGADLRGVDLRGAVLAGAKLNFASRREESRSGAPDLLIHSVGCSS